jgi:hypothetical protein
MIVEEEMGERARREENTVLGEEEEDCRFVQIVFEEGECDVDGVENSRDSDEEIAE